MGIPTPKDVVRWDLPATLIHRVDLSTVLKHYPTNKDSDLKDELTLGFQIMAGIYEGAITKKDIERLCKNTAINWNSNYEELIYDLNTITRLISQFGYFRYLHTWRTSIQELTTVGCALNFILVTYKSWLKAGKPIGTSTPTKKFVKNCFKLWDRLVYEYVNGQWSGNSDSTISNYLERVDQNEDDVFQQVSYESWRQLFNDIFENSKINDFDLKLGQMKALLYHFYCLYGISGPDIMDSIEIDHIIPKTKFDQSSLPRKDIIQDNVFNLGLLPKRDNICKSNKPLKYIDDVWLKDQISKYEQIPLDKFTLFSDVTNYKELFELRKQYFEEAYGQKRNDILNN